MKFDKEYKNEMDTLSPSDEQIERIKKAVFERIEREKGDYAGTPANAPVPRKKPLKIKIAALSGAAVCTAAALLIVVNVKPTTDSFPLFESHYANTTNGIKTDKSLSVNANENTGISGGYQINDASISNSPCDMTEDSAGTDGIPEPGDSFISSASAAAGTSLPSTQMQSPAGTPFLSFSDDKGRCTVSLNGEAQVYKKTEMIVAFEGNADHDVFSSSLTAADSDIGEKLLVQFDENDLYIFYESGEFFGHYTFG